VGERVAIIGSRDYPDLERVRAYVRRLPTGTVFISGGARGVDSAAENRMMRAAASFGNWRSPPAPECSPAVHACV
jgi:predicted Rossmann fold nucleotide-binding protein DprA/Smf involved in DNA uptake